MDNKNIIDEAKNVFKEEIKVLKLVKESIDDKFVDIINEIKNAKGKVIVTGIGKSGHIAAKISATLSSLGTSSFFLHPAEAMHGDLGMVQKEDVVIAISYSGESEEVLNILPNLTMIGCKIIAISGNENSTLCQYSEIAYIFPKFNEACKLNLAPTSSTTAALVLGDALAIVLSKIYGFKEKDFALFHPAGTLGKKLTIRVKDIMRTNGKFPILLTGESMDNAIIEISKNPCGISVVTDNENYLIGVFSDGDLRRALKKNVDIYELKIDEFITKNPIVVNESEFAVSALYTMKDKKISAMPVLDAQAKVVGIIHIQDIINAGIY